jgi:hypothetical protein
VISATSPAGIRRPPIVRNTNPRPIWQMPSVASSETSSEPTCARPANGAASTKTSTWDRHVAGAIETSRRWRVITSVAAKEADMRSERACPTAPAPPGPPTMIATPPSATPMAIQVRRATGSPSIVPSAAAMIGASACMKRTFATDA